MSTVDQSAFVLIIGAMKAGTSTLYDALSDHPQICPCVVKEPEFFSMHQGRSVEIERYEDLWQEYESGVHRYRLEASTGYTKFPQEPGVPSRIREYGLQPKFVYLVRDPVERIESEYNYCLTEPWFDPTKPLTHPDYMYISNYYVQLQVFQEHFDREDFLIVDFDDLREDVAGVERRTLSFLDLESTAASRPRETVNATRQIPLAEALVRRSAIGRSLMRRAPRAVRRAGAEVARRLSPAMPKRPLTDSERAEVMRWLAPDMKQLHSRYGIDVSKWGF